MTKKEDNKDVATVEVPLLKTQTEIQKEIAALMAELNESSKKAVLIATEKDLETKKTEREVRVRAFFAEFMTPLEKFAKDLADQVLGDLPRKSMNLSAGYVSPKGVKCVMALSMSRDTGKKDTTGKDISEDAAGNEPAPDAMDKAA